MTKQQALKWVKQWQQSLGLGDWRVAVEPRDGSSFDDGRFGRLNFDRLRRRGKVSYAKDREDDTICETLLHEVLHIALLEVDTVVKDAMELLEKNGEQLIKRAYAHAEERLIHRLTGAFLEESK